MTRTRKLVTWLAPLGVIVGLAAVGTVTMRDKPVHDTAAARPSVKQIVAGLKASVNGRFSGTVVASTSIRLPATDDDVSMSAFAAVGLLAGSNTARVWYSGKQKQRVAVVGADGEVDYFHSGANYWRWDPAGRTAVGMAMPQASAQPAWSPIPRVLPGQLSWWAVDSIDSHTQVSLVSPGSQAQVAGRSVYRVRVTPNQSASLISSIQIYADTSTYTPLAVRVYAKGQSAPAVTSTFTHINFGAPDSENFAFRPPPDSTVMPAPSATGSPSGSQAPLGADPAPSDQPVVHLSSYGTQWNKVVELRFRGSQYGQAVKTPAQLAAGMRIVAGKWGDGVLYTSPIVSMLVTRDGRILVGAVRAKTLLHCA